MNNFLGNGSVLPSGLLSHNPMAHKEAFNKTFQNTSIKIGILVATYPIGDPNNISKLFQEYDVLAFEQNENRGASVGIYKNCPMASSLGGLADWFEMSIRKVENMTTKGPVPQLSGQNGSIVLLLCLNGVSDSGVIVGALGHPDRPTTITADEPHLEGEYNGVHIVVNADGSTSLTFQGATDNNGDQIDPSQGNTTMAIAKDGSYSVSHKNAQLSLAKSGDVTIVGNGTIANSAGKNFTVSSTQDTDITAKGNFNLNSNNMTFNAQGSAMFSVESFSIQAELGMNLQASDVLVSAQSLVHVVAPNVLIQGEVALGASGGQPLLTLSAMMIGVGNLGLPVISQAISGYTTMVTGQ